MVKEFLVDANIAPIFYGQATVEDILSGTPDSRKKYNLTPMRLRDAQAFCRLGTEPDRWADTVILTLDGGHAYLYRPKDKIGIYQKPQSCKGIPVKFLTGEVVDIRNVPYVLATIKASRYYASGTFRAIKKNSVHAAAIDYLITGKRPRALNLKDLLGYLSAIEFETLVAKLFESYGLHVPAYRGGFMKDIDLLVTNLQIRPVSIEGIHIKSQETKSIQVKLSFNSGLPTNNVDFFISIDELSHTPAHNHFSHSWLARCLSTDQGKGVLAWLKQSLSWVDASSL